MKGELEWAVMALALPAEVQLSLFPDFVCKADELALEFDRSLYELQDADVTPGQRAAVDTLYGLVHAMSGERNPALWTDDALRSHPAWETVRAAARAAADAFGWKVRRPPPSAGVYIPAGSEPPGPVRSRAAMNCDARPALRLCALIMCGLCTIALFPAALGAYVGLGWLDLELPAKASAAALVAAPVPLGAAAFFAWKAARMNRRGPLLAGGACVLAAIACYVVVWAWGGRMLI